jgi:hypothetical protein
MSSQALAHELARIDPEALAEARKAFLSVGQSSFTIRRGVVSGEQQFEERLRRAIAAYKAGSSV